MPIPRALMRQQPREIWFFLFICLMYFFSLDLLWPGSITYDTYVQGLQAKKDIYDNHHPPVMAWVWHKLGLLMPSYTYGSLLVFHMLLFWACLYMMGRVNSYSSPAWPYAGVIIWLFPTVLSMSAALWKDVGLALALLLALLIMAYYYQSNRQPGRGATLLIITLLLYGAFVRHNGVSAIAPLAFLLVTITRGASVSMIRRILLSIVITVTLLGAKYGFESAIATPTSYAAQENMLFDTIYMTKRTGMPFVPEYLYKDRNMDFETFRDTVEIGWGGYVMKAKYKTDDTEKLEQLRQAYISMVTSHPLQYALYRGYMFVASLNWFGTYLSYVWDIPDSERDNTLRVTAKGYIDYWTKGVLFRTYFWFFSALAIFVAAAAGFVPARVRTTVTCLSLSGVLYALGYIPVITSADFRYYYWTMVSALFSVMLILPAWDENRRRIDIPLPERLQKKLQWLQNLPWPRFRLPAYLHPDHIRQQFTFHMGCFLAIISLLFISSYLLLTPGAFSNDSARSLGQALKNVYSDHHPPVMAWVWHITLLFMNQHGGMLLTNLLLFWSSVYVLGLINGRVKTAWMYASLLIWIIPPVLAMSCVIWKDTSAAFSLMLACMLMMYYQINQRPMSRGILLLVILMLFYTVALRHNAITGIPPIAYWLLCILYGQTITVKRKLLMTLLVCIALFAGKTAFEKAIVTKHVMASQENMLFELGFMSQIVNTPLLPSYVYQEAMMDFDSFKKKVQFSEWGRYMSDEFGTNDPERWAQLRQAYYDMLRTYPMQYLNFRWKMTRTALGYQGTYWPYMWPGDTNSPNPIIAFGRKYLNKSVTTFFKAYTWVYLTLILIVLSSFRRFFPESVRLPILYMNLSALFVMLPYYFILPSPDFRYFYWSVLVAIISIFLLLPAWDERRMKRNQT